MAVNSNAAQQEATHNRYYRASGWSTIKAFFGNYVNFTGRSSRSEYWWVILFQVLLGLIVGIGLIAMVFVAIGAGAQVDDPSQIIGSVGVGLVLALLLILIVALGLLLPTLSLLIRRYRDAGIPWWIYLIQIAINVFAQVAFEKGSTTQTLLSFAVNLSVIVLTLLPSKPVAADDTPDAPDALDGRIDPSVLAPSAAPAQSAAQAAPAESAAPAEPSEAPAESEAPDQHEDPDHPYTEG